MEVLGSDHGSRVNNSNSFDASRLKGICRKLLHTTEDISQSVSSSESPWEEEMSEVLNELRELDEKIQASSSMLESFDFEEYLVDQIGERKVSSLLVFVGVFDGGKC